MKLADIFLVVTSFHPSTLKVTSVNHERSKNLCDVDSFLLMLAINQIKKYTAARMTCRILARWILASFGT